MEWQKCIKNIKEPVVKRQGIPTNSFLFNHLSNMLKRSFFQKTAPVERKAPKVHVSKGLAARPGTDRCAWCYSVFEGSDHPIQTIHVSKYHLHLDTFGGFLGGESV